jgi:hypothetical protein
VASLSIDRREIRLELSVMAGASRPSAEGPAPTALAADARNGW